MLELSVRRGQSNLSILLFQLQRTPTNQLQPTPRMLFKRTLRYIWAHAALQINSMLHVFGLQ